MAKTVITFGTFDVLHVGHVRVLNRAAEFGDRLVVGVSSDALNFSKKGRNPVFSQDERVELVSNMKVVDEVFVEESLDLKRDYITRARRRRPGHGRRLDGQVRLGLRRLRGRLPAPHPVGVDDRPSSSTSSPPGRSREPDLAVLLDLTPLRASPAFRRLWAGLSLSNLGTQLSVVAVGLQIYDITRSTFSVGLLGIFALVPLVLLGLYGGALVDAYDRRRVALFSALGLWVVVLGLVAQALLGMESVELLYGLVALQSAGFAINNPARTAIIPRLVEPRLLPAANVLQTVAWNIALTVGPLIAAFLVAGPGFAAAYAVDAVLFTAALWALWRLPDLPPIVGPDDKRLRLGLSAVVDGFRYLATRPNVRMTFVVDLIAMIVAMPRVLFPAVGVLFLGGGAFTTGVLSAAFAAGAVLAGLSPAVWSGWCTRGG